MVKPIIKIKYSLSNLYINFPHRVLNYYWFFKLDLDYLTHLFYKNNQQMLLHPPYMPKYLKIYNTTK